MGWKVGGQAESAPGTSYKRLREEVEDEEDIVDLLEESEALELVKFDPEVKPSDSWEPPPSREVP